MLQGTIKTLVQDRGFGFISTSDKDVFFHVSSCEPGMFDFLSVGQKVEYELEKDNNSSKGPRAAKVQA